MRDAARLYKTIKHGDKEHRAWLREACDCFFAGKPVPPPRGRGSRETTEAERDRLQARVEELEAEQAGVKALLDGIHRRDVKIAEAMRERAAKHLEDRADLMEKQGDNAPLASMWRKEAQGVRALPLEEKDGE